MMIDKKSPVPLYYQLKQVILERIKGGEWLPNMPISSERELSELFEVSRMTVRQAINELENEGILYRERGRGTFVSPPRIEQSDVMSFTEAAVNRGLKASTIVKKFDIKVPDVNILNSLELNESEEVYYVRRFRMINDIIIGIEDIYLPVEFAGRLTSKDLSGSLYELLKEKYNYSVSHVQTNLEAIIPTADKLKLFQVAEAVPLLKVTSIHITGQDVKLYYEESIYRSDKFILNVNIYRK